SVCLYPLSLHDALPIFALKMLERGFITQTPSHDWNVLRIEPALIMKREELDAFVDALEETVDDELHESLVVGDRFLEGVDERVRSEEHTSELQSLTNLV